MPFQEWVGFLHCPGVLVALLFFHGCAGERRSAKAAPVCGLADKDDVIPLLPGFFRSFTVDDFVLAHDAEGNGIHETVTVVG